MKHNHLIIAIAIIVLGGATFLAIRHFRTNQENVKVQASCAPGCTPVGAYCQCPETVLR